MKKSRKKVWMPIVALCSAGLMVGTGYAAWTIARNQSGEATGNRKADTVVDNRISITNIKWYEGSYSNSATPLTGNPTVCFGWEEDKSQTAAGSWLKHGDDGVKENRKFTLYFEVTIAEGSQITYNPPTATFALQDTSDKVFEACVTDYILIAPDNLTVNQIEQTNHYTVDVSFKWGTKFGKDDNGRTTDTNPYVYYNSTDKYDEAVETLNKLAKLNTATSGDNKDKPSFKITISATAK